MTYDELVKAIIDNVEAGEVFAELRAVGRLAGATVTIEGTVRDINAATLYLNEVNGAGFDLFAYYDTGEGEGVRRKVGTLERDPNYDEAGVWVG